MNVEKFKNKYPVIYRVLRDFKSFIRFLVSPDSSAMVKQNVQAARKEVESLMEIAYPRLDIGAGSRGVDKSITMDINYSPGINLLGDVHQLPFKKESFGFVWLGGVLEHFEKPFEAVAEVFDVMKRGGYVYVEMPFFQRVHAAPHDYQRFTLDGIESLFRGKGFQTVKSGLIAGPSSACSHVLRTYLSLLFSFNSEKIFHVLYYYFWGWVLLPLKYFDVFLIKYKLAYLIPFGIYYLGQKKS